MLPFGIGVGEIMLIMVVVLLVVGPEKLPDLAKTMAKGLRTARKASQDLKEAIDIEGVRQDIQRSVYDPIKDWRAPVTIEDVVEMADGTLIPDPSTAQIAAPETDTDVEDAEIEESIARTGAITQRGTEENPAAVDILIEPKPGFEQADAELEPDEPA